MSRRRRASAKIVVSRRTEERAYRPTGRNAALVAHEIVGEASEKRELAEEDLRRSSLPFCDCLERGVVDKSLLSRSALVGDLRKGCAVAASPASSMLELADVEDEVLESRRFLDRNLRCRSGSGMISFV